MLNGGSLKRRKMEMNFIVVVLCFIVCISTVQSDDDEIIRFLQHTNNGTVGGLINRILID